MFSSLTFPTASRPRCEAGAVAQGSVPQAELSGQLHGRVLPREAADEPYASLSRNPFGEGGGNHCLTQHHVALFPR